MPRILLVEDEVSIADTLVYALETEHFQVTHVTTAGAALQCLRDDPGGDEMALAILDVGLPDMSGFDLCREIQNLSSLPVLFLTARDSEIDRILGLELGGDDYVTKPFSPREVCARVRAVLRRTQVSSQVASTSGHTVDGRGAASPSHTLRHDPAGMVVYYHGHSLELTAYEYKLLLALMSQPGRIFTREQLLEKAWDDPGSAMDRTVDAHIKSLRSKMRLLAPEEEDPIQTRRGLGYTLSVEC